MDDLFSKQSIKNLKNAEKSLNEGDASNSLILADQSLELFLKSCSIFVGATEQTTLKTSDGKEKPFSRWGFSECMIFLDKHNFLTSEEKSNFFMFHSWRNPVQHIGIEPSKTQVENVIRLVKDFIDSQIIARKQSGITTPFLRRFLKAIDKIDPDSSLVEIDVADKKIKYNSEIIQHRTISKLTDEELVRSYIVTKLVKELRYSPNKIELEVPIKIGKRRKFTESRIDILVRKDEKPFMVFEVKKPESYEEELDEGIKSQLYQSAYVIDKNKQDLKYLLYFSADTTEEVGLIEEFVTIDFQKYPTFDEWNKDGRPNVMLIPKEYGIIRKPTFIKGSEIDLKTKVTRKELDTIRWNLHNILYGGGKYQTELFFNVLGLFLAKIYDEKNTIEGDPYVFQIIYKNGDAESPDEVYEKVDKLYRNALRELLGFSDEEINKDKGIVFDSPKVKYVVDILQGISITTSEYDVLGDFFENIVWGEFKQSKGQYFTHPILVKFILKALDIEKFALKLINSEKRLPYVIDPSCGSGTFLIEVMKMVTDYILSHSKDLKKSKQIMEFASSRFPLNAENRWADDFIYGVEINKDLAMATKVNMVMHGDGSANIEARDALLPFKEFSKSGLQFFKKTDVYSKPINEMFDMVISNPPFSVTIDRDTAEQLPETFLWGDKIAESLSKQKEKKEVSTETLFIERWFQLLKPHGRLGVVLPETIFSAPENREIRLFLYKFFKIKAIVSIPKLAFKPFANSKTSLLLAQKKSKIEIQKYSKVWDKFSEEFDKKYSEIKIFKKSFLKENTSIDEFSKKYIFCSY